MKAKTQTTKNTIAVIINDVHYNLKTLDIADEAVNQAIDKANDLDVRLVVAGDLHDTKANLRGECVQRMIKTFKRCFSKPVILIGNHCLINEKSKDHSLEFLRAYAHIIDHAKFLELADTVVYMIPYQSDKNQFKRILDDNHENRIIICHQGLESSESGDYFKDHSAIPQEWTKNHIFISGHYHKRQTIGTWTYTGNPYTLTFGEAKDPAKGFHVLYSDGSLEFIPTNLRKHIVIEAEVHKLGGMTADLIHVRENDLAWVKIRGPKTELNKLKKEDIAIRLDIKSSFKLDLIPDKVETKSTTKSTNQSEVLDDIIESATGIEKDTKQRLKDLWKSYANQTR